MKLNVMERLMLLSILPKEGSFTNLKLLRTVKEDLSFSEEENKALQFNQNGEILTWDSKADANKEIVFGEVIESIIRKALVALDKAEKITENHYSIYEMFMDGHEEN
ncbi:MAG: hypothetical protein WC373_09550 [Smithella sp.]|jgi:hypothetical protein